MSAPIRTDRDEHGVAVVTVDHPPLNLFDRDLHAALRAVVDDLQADVPRAVLFRAEGRVVSAGVDVKVFVALDGPDAAAEMFADLVDLARRVDHLPCPTVFAAHALCLTWAFELALACDLIVAADSATFGLIEATVGLTPAMGGTQRLAERAGTTRARELVMTAGRYDAATLERWNVINQVVPATEVDTVARELAGSLAAGPTLAHGATKQVLRQFVEGGVEQANAEVPRIAGELFATDDLTAAMRTFVEHGPGHATFHGH